MDVGPLTASLYKSAGQLKSGSAASSSVTSGSDVAASAAVATIADTASVDQVAQAVSRVNDILAATGQNLRGSIDRDDISGLYIYKIVDTETMDVIRQLPPKEVVAFARSLEQPQGLRGLLVQETG